MNGVHDLGGKHGFGPVERDANEPYFHADWEKVVLVMNLIGLGFGPTFLGAASDYFRPSHPEHSLQMAFYTLVPFYALAVLSFLWLARAIKRTGGTP